MSTLKIRLITPEDNQAIAKVVRDVLMEMGAPKVGTAYEDVALDMMYETYDVPRRAYFLVVDKDEVLGGAGIAQLEGASDTICELQKMYFLSKARGKGIGTKMMNACLEYAKSQGFEKCYLETMPYMEAARKLYARTGFVDLEAPIGDTGHYSCQAWMIKEL